MEQPPGPADPASHAAPGHLPAVVEALDEAAAGGPGVLTAAREQLLADPWAAVGGWRGLVEASLPAAVYGVAVLVASRREAIIAALAVALVVFVVRIGRHERVGPAVNGFLGVVIAAAFAAALNSNDAFFLPGMIINAVYGLGCLLSVLARRPFAGYAAALVEPRFAGWRADPELRSAAMRASWIWVGVFGLRLGAMVPLYLAGATGLLAAARIALGLPLYVGGIVWSLAIIRRAVHGRAAPARPAPDAG